MKKHELFVVFHSRRRALKTLLVMKLILFLACVFTFTLQASAMPESIAQQRLKSLER